jgi:flavodoxin
MSTILITFAGRSGSTGTLAEALGKELRDAGDDVTIARADHAPDARHFDVVVVGSQLHGYHWERPALDYIRHHAPDLAERPTFLFQDLVEASGHSTTPHAVQHLVLGLGTSGPHSFAVGQTPDDRRRDVLAWAKQISGDLASPHDGAVSARRREKDMAHAA